MSNKINTDPEEIEEFLTRGTVKVIKKDELKKKMSSGKKLRAYIGYDVTGPDLHIGHQSTLIKLLHWQELGHQVVLVIGDYTSRIGDHSDKLEKRKRLTDKEIEYNKSQFKEQFGKIIDLDKAEVRYNSEWLSDLSFLDVVNLASLYSVQQMIERENFAKRLKNETTIGLEEILYPLMQGYDSVALDVDLELGATDQTFNLLAGRKIMASRGMEPQSIITMPFVTGSDGRKMGKSLGNYIPMRASAEDMYGGIMSCVDEVIIEYFTRLTRIPIAEIKEMEESLEEGEVSPLELKKKLARTITEIYYDKKTAQVAEKHFENTVQGDKIPEDIPEVDLSGKMTALKLAKSLVEKGFIESNAQAKRLIKQGGFEVDGKKINELNKNLDIDTCVIKIGKRKYVRVK